MAAVLAAPVAEAGGKAVDWAAGVGRDFSKDPMKWVADHAVKWGFMTALAGGLSYIVSVASARQEQAFLNDIQARLGQPTTVSPTPPKAPPPAPTPTLAQTTMTIVAGSVYNIDLTNSKVTGQKCLDAVNALQMLLDQLLAQGGSPDAIAGCVLGIQDFGLAAQQLGWWPPGTSVTVAPTNPGDPPTTLTYQVWTYDSAKTVYWSQAEDWVWVASNATNQVAQALNLPVPFNVPTAAPGAPPPPKPVSATTFGWLSGFTAFIVQGVVSLGADAQQAVNDVTGAIGTVANDVQAFAGDVGKAVAFASRMILNLPIIGFDALGYGVCWFGHTVFGDMAPWLLGLGVGLMVAGAVAGMLYPKIVPRMKLGIDARSARFWNRFDNWFHTREKAGDVWAERGTEAMIEAAAQEPVYTRSTTGTAFGQGRASGHEDPDAHPETGRKDGRPRVPDRRGLGQGRGQGSAQRRICRTVVRLTGATRTEERPSGGIRAHPRPSDASGYADGPSRRR